MEQIKDQQRLFEKLFVSPNSDNHCGFILSMQFLKLLLDESQQLTLSAQKILLFEVLRLFEKQPVNSLLLYKYDEGCVDQRSLLCSLVLTLTRIIRTPQDIDEMLPLFDSLLSFYPVGLLHVTSITRELSIQFHHGSFNPLRTKFYHAVLEKYYGCKLRLDAEPLNYFFFYAPNENSIIHSPENTKIPIKNELSIYISFKTLVPVNSINLFWIATNHESLAIKIGKQISIQNQSTGVHLSDNENIRPGTWYWLLANLTLSETCLYLNGEEIIREKRGLLRKEKQRQIREYAIGEEFIGFIGAVLVLEKPVPMEALKDFNTLQRWKQVISLNEKKLQSLVAISCLPYTTFEMRQCNNCFDIFRKSHSIIGENIAIFHNPLTTGIGYMGNYEVLLPLFYLARFYDAKEYPEHLESILRIWLVALQNFYNFKDPENLEQFMVIAGHHLQSLPHLLTDNCVGILSQIYQRLSPGNKIRFLRHVGWSGLPGRSEGLGVRSWLNWLTKLYQNNKSECLRSYGLMDVVFWLVKNLQNNQQHCCPQHYINQARALREFDFQQLRKIEDSTKKQHFEAVENIAAVILEYSIIDHPDQAVKSVKSVLRLLLHKYSNCLYYTILKILKRQIPKFRNDKDVSQILLAANILPFLAALAQKVVDHSLLSLILYLMLLVSQFAEDSRREVVAFFCIVFRRLKDIHQQHFNLLSHGARKVRKRSLDDSAITQQSVTNLLDRLRQYRSNFGDMKFLLINCCVGVVDDCECSKQTKFVDEEGFTLLRCFIPLADRPLRLEILTLLKDKLKQNTNNSEFCQVSAEFTKLLLDVIEEEPAREMLTEIIESQLRRKVHLGDYYIQIKNISRSQLQTAEIFCDVFTMLFKKQFKFSLTQLYQILLLMTNQTKDQEEPQGYWLLISAITRNISQIVKHHLLSLSGVSKQTDELELVERVKALAPQVLQGAHFQLQLNNINEEEVNFLFDIILPKLIAGCSVTHLLKDMKRPVYIFEIYLYQLMATIQRKPQQSQLISNMVETVIVFLSEGIVRPEEETNKSFMRMVLFLTTYFLLQIDQIEPVLMIWSFIIGFIRKVAERYKAQTYVQLRESLYTNKIQPFLIEIFEVFLRSSNEEFLIPIEALINPSLPIKELIKQKLFIIFKKEEFTSILNACKKNAFDQLYREYQQKIMAQQARLDMEEKTSKQHTLFQAVQKIFEQQSIGEQETRLKHLHEHENYLRQYHSSWNQLWKRMRIYHHPYGIFNAQKDSLTSFCFHSDKLKNFRFKMSKYSSTSGIQPILEVDILEPWHVRKLMQQESKNQVNNLVELMRPNQAIPKVNAGVMDTFTSFIKRISGQRGPKVYTEYQVLWIKGGRKARGKLIINDRDEIVFWYESLKQEDSHLSFERFSLMFNEPMVKSWRIDYIRKVQERRYLMHYNALQIVLLSRKSILFHFEDHRNREFLQELQRLRASKLQLMGAKLKLNKVPFYLDDWYQDGLSPKIIEDWRNRKISNLEYLIAVNRAASRGIYDISQYPVFPWVCEMRDEKQPSPRDLSKTMGALGSEERRKIVSEKYTAADPFNPVPAFHFGTHYSSPGVVFNFLIRLAPFTDYCKNLQGGRFDIPDRLFSSLVQAWRSASTEVSDVRELIPEFYYLPECLLNSERLHLGDTQSGERVDHVELPPWAAGNPYFFIAQMRQMLESEESSAGIGQWLDLLFGVKQRGPAAKDNFNVYYYLTYQDYSNCLTDSTDDVYRKSCEAQIVHFGQIPPQVFEKEHPRRVPRNSSLGPVELRVVEKVTLMNNLKEKLVGAYRQGNQLIFIKRNTLEVLSLSKTLAVLTRNIEFNFERTLSRSLFGIKKEEAKVIFFRQYFLVYGYLTNEFRIFNRTNGAIEFDESLSSRVDYAHVSQDESLILLGCHLGTLYIYEVQYDAAKLSAKKVYSEPFLHAISHISQRDGFFTISFGCYVSIYKFERSLYYLSKDTSRPFVRFFRSFHNSLPVRGAFIADSPLYSLVLFDKANVKVYSANGQLLKVLACTPKKVSPLKDRELNSLFCVEQESRLLLLSAPDLRWISELQLGGALQVIGDMIVYEKAIHFIAC